jgi:hypothetical protein
MLFILFLLELCALVALSWAGFAVQAPLGVRIAFGVGLPLVAAVAWGLFAAPRAKYKVAPGVVTTVKVLVYGAATLAIFALGHERLALAYPLAVAAVTGLIRTGKPDDGVREPHSS